MTNTAVVHQDALIFLFILILVWILYFFEYPIADKLSNRNLKRYLNKLPLFKDVWQLSDNPVLSDAHSPDENTFDIDQSHSALLMLMRRIGFALLLLFCLPIETVHVFKSNAQYYWSILLMSIALYQCIKLLVFEQLEQFSDNAFVHRLICQNQKKPSYEKEILSVVACCALFCILLTSFW